MLRCKKKKSSDWVSFFDSLLKPGQNNELLQRPSLAPGLPSPHPLLCQWQPQWLQVFSLCIGGVFLGAEPCFLSAYQQPLCAPPTNLADMVLSFRTPQAVAAVTHSQTDLHACPPPPSPPPPFIFDLCPTDLAQPLLLFYFYIRSKFLGFPEYLGKSCRKGSVVNVLLLCHHHACIALALRHELRFTEIYVS